MSLFPLRIFVVQYRQFLDFGDGPLLLRLARLCRERRLGHEQENAYQSEWCVWPQGGLQKVEKTFPNPQRARHQSSAQPQVCCSAGSFMLSPNSATNS